jgi:PAS domain-containing protein
MTLDINDIISELPIVVFVIDKDGKFLLSIGKGLEKLGLKPNQVVGLSVYDIYKDVPDVIASIKLAFEGQRAYFINKVNDMYFETWYLPIHGEDGTVNKLYGYAQDVSPRVQAENDLKQRTIELERLNKVMVDRELRIVELKEQVKQLEDKINISSE